MPPPRRSASFRPPAGPCSSPAPAIALSLALVAVIGPTQLMVSLGTGMLACALFATGGAVVVMPAALVLLGRRIDFLRFPAPAPLARAWSRLRGWRQLGHPARRARRR